MQLGAFGQAATVEKQGKKVHVDKGLITRPDVSASPFYITELNLLFGSVLQRNVLLLLPDETASLGCFLCQIAGANLYYPNPREGICQPHSV